MMLYIDPREGSNKLLEKFPGECEAMTLEAGDIALWGNGPDDVPWWIGIEYKQVGDLVSCIKDGRFAGTQLPNMLKLYDVCFLLIEGNYQPDYKTATYNGDYALWVPFGGGRGIRYGMSYKAFDNYTLSVAVFSALVGKPCIVKRSRDKSESVLIIKDIYDFFQKQWHEHKSMSMHDRSKMSRAQHAIELLQVEPEDSDYPRCVLRKSLFQIKGVGWDNAHLLANNIGTMENALTLSQNEIELLGKDGNADTRGIGKVLSKRIYETLHGHPEPVEIKKRKRKGKQ